MLEPWISVAFSDGVVILDTKCCSHRHDHSILNIVLLQLLAYLIFTSFFFYYLLSLFSHRTKTICVESACVFNLFLACRRIGEYISLELFCITTIDCVIIAPQHWFKFNNICCAVGSCRMYRVTCHVTCCL